MAFDFQKAKSLTRQVVHDTLAVTAFYKDSSMSEPAQIKARYHTKTGAPLGDLNGDGYAVIVEAVDRVVFSAQDARAINVRRGGEVWFPAVGAGLGAHLGSPLGGEGVGPAVFILDNQVKNTGPVTETWEVVRK